MSEMRKQGIYRQLQGKNNNSKSGKIRSCKKIKHQGKGNLRHKDEMKILEEKNNLLFKRKEIVAEMQTKSSPNFSEIEKFLSEKFGVLGENIKIKKIHGSFGNNSFVITAFIYNSKEDKEKTEITKKQPVAKTV